MNGVNRYFTNVGKEAFEKSHKNIKYHDNESQLNACNTVNLKCNMFRPQSTDSQTTMLALKQLKNSTGHI